MKTNFKQLLIIGTGCLLLAGCCTTHHVTKYEYKVVHFADADQSNWMPKQESYLNEIGKDGWILVNVSDQYYYFKRPVK